MNLREEIFNLLKDDWLTQQEPMDYRLAAQTDRIMKLFVKWLNEYELKFIMQEQTEDDPMFKLAAKFHNHAAKRMKKMITGEEKEKPDTEIVK